MFEIKILLDGHYIGGKSFNANYYEFAKLTVSKYLTKKGGDDIEKSLLNRILDFLHTKAKAKSPKNKDVKAMLANYLSLTGNVDDVVGKRLDVSFTLNGQPLFGGKDFYYDLNPYMARKLFTDEFDSLLEEWMYDFETALKTHTTELELMKNMVCGYMTDKDDVITMHERRYSKLDRLRWDTKWPLMQKVWNGEALTQRDLDGMYTNYKLEKATV